MNHLENSKTVRCSRKNQMTSHVYKNGSLLTALAKRLESINVTEFITQKIQLVFAVIFLTKLMFLITQPAWGQQSVYIGSKRTMPEVVVNLGAIVGTSNTNFKNNLPLIQPNHTAKFGNTRLLIPNLRASNKTRFLKLRSPRMSGPAVFQETPVLARRTGSGEASTADARVAPTVALPSLPSKGRDVLVAVLPSVSQKSADEQPKDGAATSMLRKRMGGTNVETAREKSKFIRSAKISKSTSDPSKRRLNPPLPPPPKSVIEKRKINKFKVPAAKTLMAKKLEKFSAKSTNKSKTKLDRVASLRSAGNRILEVRFRSGSSVLTRKDEKMLLNFAQKIGSTASRMQLKAFAEATGNNSSKARRLSLSRALAVRSFLIENGLRSTSIDVRALGIARDGGAPDRVDIVSLDR